MSLTYKERKVMEMLASGLKQEEIAKEMGIKRRSVERYPQIIRSKMGCKTFLEAMFEFGKMSVSNPVSERNGLIE